ncbi:MAG: hypothetical protein ACE5D8_07245 [Fidelibacterota bacterium]
MYIFVLTNDSLYGLSWFEDEGHKKITETFTFSFEKQILSCIADEQQLANTIGGILSRVAEGRDFAGETVHVFLDETLVFEEIIILRDDLDTSELQQYFEQKKQWFLGDIGAHYTYRWIENPDVRQEYHVTFIPAGLPDALKLSIRELGAKPGHLLAPGILAFIPDEVQVRHAVFESVRGYTVYGYTVRGNFITDLKFLSGLPKYSNWCGDTTLQEHLFADEMDEIDSRIAFIGTYTPNQKSHWLESCGYVEIPLSDWEIPTDLALSSDEISVCQWVADTMPQALPNLYDSHGLTYTVTSEPELKQAERPAVHPEKESVEAELVHHSRYHGVLVTIFLLTSLTYIAANWNSIREWHYVGYKPPEYTINTYASLPETAQFWQEQSRNYLSILTQIITKPALQDFNDVVISSDELELLYPDTIQVQNILSEILSDSSPGEEKERTGFFIAPPQWRSQFLQLFPTGTLDVYRVIHKAGFDYVPVTLRLTSGDSIVRCLRWLEGSYANIIVRKAELHRDDSRYSIVLYIALLSQS